MRTVDASLRPSGWRIAESIPLTLLRLALGGLMIFAAVIKIDDPTAFAIAIRSYGLIESENGSFVLPLLAYTIPWIELVTGVCLVLGARGRGAAFLLAAMLAAFTLANYLVIDDNVRCSCFGDKDPFCKDPIIGRCQMIRDGVMLGVALLLAWRGAGVWSVDHALSRLRASSAAHTLDRDDDEA